MGLREVLLRSYLTGGGEIVMKDVANAKKHLNAHQKFPATKEELVAECDNLSDFSDVDRKWFKENLPEGTYDSADAVLKALDL